MSNIVFWTVIACFLSWQATVIYRGYLSYKVECMYIEDSRKLVGIMLEKNRETSEQVNRLIEILGNK